MREIDWKKSAIMGMGRLKIVIARLDSNDKHYHRSELIADLKNSALLFDEYLDSQQKPSKEAVEMSINKAQELLHQVIESMDGASLASHHEGWVHDLKLVSLEFLKHEYSQQKPSEKTEAEMRIKALEERYDRLSAMIDKVDTDAYQRSEAHRGFIVTSLNELRKRYDTLNDQVNRINKWGW